MCYILIFILFLSKILLYFPCCKYFYNYQTFSLMKFKKSVPILIIHVAKEGTEQLFQNKYTNLLKLFNRVVLITAALLH